MQREQQSRSNPKLLWRAEKIRAADRPEQTVNESLRTYVNTLLTLDDVRSQVSYDPSTGIFTRTNSPSRKGMVTGSSSVDGKYVTIYLNGKARYAHRLAWLYVFGEWPRGEIDHINGDGRDNSLGNLRDVDRKTNQQNIRKPIADKTLPIGVHLAPRKKTNRFSASIRIGGKSVHLGWFNSPEEAGAAYVAAKRKHHAGCTI